MFGAFKQNFPDIVDCILAVQSMLAAHQRHYKLAEKVMASANPDVRMVPAQYLINTRSHPGILRVPVIRAFARRMKVFQDRMRLSQVETIVIDSRHLCNPVDFFELREMLFLHDNHDFFDRVRNLC